MEKRKTLQSIRMIIGTTAKASREYIRQPVKYVGTKRLEEKEKPDVVSRK